MAGIQESLHFLAATSLGDCSTAGEVSAAKLGAHHPDTKEGKIKHKSAARSDRAQNRTQLRAILGSYHPQSGCPAAQASCTVSECISAQAGALTSTSRSGWATLALANNIVMYWDTLWIMTIYPKVIYLSPVEVLSLGGTATRQKLRRHVM